MHEISRLCALVLVVTCVTHAEIKNKGWWKNTIFYQIYPRSFMDSNNDGIGDLKGITSKLHHFLDAGVGGIWLSPIYSSPMVDFGYDVSDFKDIDPAFGTMQDFEEMTARAKQLGLKVILDFVPNYTSDEHEWFKKSLAGIGKYKDFFVWRNGRNMNRSPPNNWISVFSGPAWTYNTSRNMWYLHQFEYRQPDLNYSNPEVRAEMEEVVRFWLAKGVDGFRVDAVPHIYEHPDFKDEPRSFIPGATEQDHTYLNHIYTKDDPRTYELIRSWRKVLDDFANLYNTDEKVMMTEAYTNLPNTTKFYAYGSHIPFNFKFITDVTASSDALSFKEVIDNWMSHMPADGTANWVMGNHDRVRIGTRYMGRSDQMTMLAMILPGVVVTYYGEELGMLDNAAITWEETKDPQACNAGFEKYQNRSRDPCRTPFQWDNTKNSGFSKAASTWLPVHANYKELNLANQKAASESHYKVYQALTYMRKTSSAVKQGSLKTLALNDKRVLTVIRQSPTQSMVLLINFVDNSPQTVNISTQVSLHGNMVVEIASVDSSVKPGVVVNPSMIKIPAKATLILRSGY